MGALFALSKDIQKLIIESPLPEILENEIHKAYHDLEREMGGGSFSVALRSSAMGEDSIANSFAGQYRSELNVRKEDLSQTYKDIIASNRITSYNVCYTKLLRYVCERSSLRTLSSDRYCCCWFHRCLHLKICLKIHCYRQKPHHFRITSYNVCYTKLLRPEIRTA